MTKAPPFFYSVDLLSVTQTRREEAFAVPEAACEAIAELYEVDGIEGLSVQISLWRLSDNEFALKGHFAAIVLQTCIVTLKPLRTPIEQDFERRYSVLPRGGARPKASASPPTVKVELETDEVDSLTGSKLDLAAPVLEELSLAIDPYPRIPGAALEDSSEGQSAEESPFAVLQMLKDKMEPPEKS